MEEGNTTSLPKRNRDKVEVQLNFIFGGVFINGKNIKWNRNYTIHQIITTHFKS